MGKAEAEGGTFTFTFTFTFTSTFTFIFTPTLAFTWQTLGKQVHDAFPHLSVIAYSTVVETNAAACFAEGFYSHIGKALLKGQRARIEDAFEAAKQTWELPDEQTGVAPRFKVGESPWIQFA